MTSLAPIIGYEPAAALAKEVVASGKTVRQLAEEKQVLPQAQLDEALDPRSMRVNAAPDLWCFGELIDLAGPIGGLNFQAAFACAELAAKSVGSESR